MRLLSILLTLTLALFSQVTSIPANLSGGSGTPGAPNPIATSVGAVTSLAIDVSSLSLSDVRRALVQCWSGAAAPFSQVTITSLNPATTSSITANFTSTANITCRANGTGSPGTNGSNGSTGATGSTGPAGEVTSADSSAVDSQMVVMSGTTGKAIKKSALTGVIVATGGVPAAVTGTATDCVKVDGTSGACGGGGFTGNTWADLTAITWSQLQ